MQLLRGTGNRSENLLAITFNWFIFVSFFLSSKLQANDNALRGCVAPMSFICCSQQHTISLMHCVIH